MSKSISWIFLRFLLVAAIFMLVWGLLGFLEYLFGISIISLQNSDFPSGTQFVHWFLITLSGSMFLFGYVTKSRHTPTAMLVIYAMLGTMCTIQTFDMMTAPNRYVAFAIEIAAYICISIYLLKSPYSKEYFCN